MPPKGYKNLNVRPEDYIIFRKLKHRLEIDSDIEAFAKMMKMITEDLNGGNEKQIVSDGVAG
jgi:hypothetical protein